MNFFAVLTKEMRLRLRQEHTIWVLIVYVLLLGLLGWFYLSHTISNRFSDWDTIGVKLYQLFTLIQIVFIIFITPALTSGAINGEKELKTYDILLCSQLSSFSLVAGKLIAGLSNALLLIVATIPLFSLVFFFGGFTSLHILQDLAVVVITAAMITSFALFCSTLFDKRSVSTAIAYMVVLLWLIVPFLSVQFVLGPVMDQQYILNILVWNPLVILSLSGGIFFYISGNSLLAGIPMSPWLAYMIISAGATLLFFLLSLCFVKPYLLSRIRVCLMAYRKYGRKSGK